MQLAICWSGSSHLQIWRQKSNCSSHIVTPFMDVSSHIVTPFMDVKRLINVSRCTSSSLTIAMNATDQIKVVLRKLAYSLMSRVVASLNSIVTPIVNSEPYHHSQ